MQVEQATTSFKVGPPVCACRYILGVPTLYAGMLCLAPLKWDCAIYASIVTTHMREMISNVFTTACVVVTHRMGMDALSTPLAFVWKLSHDMNMMSSTDARTKVLLMAC